MVTAQSNINYNHKILILIIFFILSSREAETGLSLYHCFLPFLTEGHDTLPK